MATANVPEDSASEQVAPVDGEKDSLDATVDMIELFDKTVAENDATFVIYYRGHW